MNRNPVPMLVLLMCIGMGLLAIAGPAEGLPTPNIIDAPRHSDDNIPAAIAGNPRPLLDGDAKTVIYDLASTITDESFDAMESNYIGMLWYPFRLLPFGQFYQGW